MSSPPPAVPPRPSRSQASSPPETSAPNPPVVPPRPSRRPRSKSPMPENTVPADSATTAAENASAENNNKAPSVRFKSTDDEGNSPEQTKIIPADLELKQPEPVPTGREQERQSRHSMHYMTSSSTRDEDTGLRIPLHPHSGDVQAPTPTPSSRTRSRSRPRPKKIPVPDGHSDEMIVGDYGAYPSEQHVHRLGGTYSHSAEDLNHSVRKAIKGAGVATTPGLEGVPDEEIGYMASDEYTSRLNSPLHSDGTHGAKPSTPHVVSPLAKQAFPFSSEGSETAGSAGDKRSSRDIYVHHGRGTSSEYLLASPHGSSTNLAGYRSGTPAGPHPQEIPEYQDELHEGIPILASDEVNKSTHHLPAAISPRVRSPELQRPSQASSPALQAPREYEEYSDEDVEEEDLEMKKKKKAHEPLFPESPKEEKPKIPSRPKHREHRDSHHREQQKFPSKDIWEDAPDSTKVMYEVKDEPQKEEADDEWIEEQTGKIAKVTTEGQLKKELAEENKAATGGAPPPLPSHRPAPRKRTEDPTESSISPGGVSPEIKKSPLLPSGAKPLIPARPTRRKESGDEPTSASSAGSEAKSPVPPVTKPKPMIPPKVGGGIAALRANFMSDLNSKLKLGPAPPKKEETEEKDETSKEKEVLSDARKGRARGPQRRKPTPSAAATEAAASATSDSGKAVECKMTMVFTLWSIDEGGQLQCKEAFMTDAAPEDKKPATLKEEESSGVPVEAVVAKHEDEMPKEEVDTVKEVVEVTPTPAQQPLPPSEPQSAVVEGKGAEVIQPPIPMDADKETEAVTSAVLDDPVAGGKDVKEEGSESKPAVEEATA